MKKEEKRKLIKEYQKICIKLYDAIQENNEKEIKELKEQGMKLRLLIMGIQ